MRKITMISAVTASLLLIGCGGGGASSAATGLGTGFYVDAAVKGVSYECGNQSGTTDSDGKG